MTQHISEKRFVKKRRSDALGKPKKVQVNVYIDPVRREALEQYCKVITEQLRPLRGSKFSVIPSDLVNDYLDRDLRFRTIEKRLHKEYNRERPENSINIE